MKNFLAAALLSSALIPVAFANTNAGSKLYVSSAAVGDTDMDQADFEAFAWVQVGGLGNVGETGVKTNLLNYDRWNTTVTQKAKGISDAGSPTVECARKYNDAGQVIMRAAGAPTNTLNYAFSWFAMTQSMLAASGPPFTIAALLLARRARTARMKISILKFSRSVCNSRKWLLIRPLAVLHGIHGGPGHQRND